MNIREEHYIAEPNTGCWIWLGYLQEGGYGQIGRNSLAHRISYEENIGPIPDGHHLHHVCETRCCVNPQHLKALTPGDHIRRTLADNGRSYFWKNREPITHCVRGHEFDEENTYWQPGKNKRYCRKCIKINNDKRYAHQVP